MLEILITSVLFSDDSVFFPSSCSWLFFDNKSIFSSTEVEDANDEILIPVVVSLVVSLLLVSSLLSFDEFLSPPAPESETDVSLFSLLILFCSVTTTEDPPTLDSEAMDEILRPKSAEALSLPGSWSISLLFSVVTEEICRISWLLS